MGEGVREVEPLIAELISNSQNELQVLAYVLTPGALRILSLIEQAASRGVRATLLVNDLESQRPEIKEELARITAKHPKIKALSFGGGLGILHAKVVVSEQEDRGHRLRQL